MGGDMLRINRIMVGVLGVVALVTVAMPSTPASSATFPEILGSGHQFPAGPGDTGFFAMYATGSGNTAMGSFTLSQSGWPNATTRFKLRTAIVTCVLYDFDGPQAIVTGTVTSGSHTETVVALTFHKNGAVFLRFSFAPNISTVSPGCDAPTQMTGIAIRDRRHRVRFAPDASNQRGAGLGHQSAGGLLLSTPRERETRRLATSPFFKVTGRNRRLEARFVLPRSNVCSSVVAPPRSQGG